MEKEIRYDLNGIPVVTDALISLLNDYPGLADDDEITFADLGEEGGITIVPISGAVIETEKTDITDHVTQVCLYPFYVIYREKDLSERRKIKTKEWLDNLGMWMERQIVTINDAEYRLKEYPDLTGDRKFLSIERQSPAYLDKNEEDATEDWVIYISARYQNEFNRN
jgi:hypothetical protein